MTVEEKQVSFLKENYPHLGRTLSAEKLNVSVSRVHYLCEKHKIKMNKTDYSRVHGEAQKRRFERESQEKTILNSFISEMTDKKAYLLGFLWADGHICKFNKTIKIEIREDDGENLKELFTSLINWKISKRQKETSKNKSMIFAFYDRPFSDFLKQNDYWIKSQASPTKILNVIPKNLHCYFWQGFLDGDGCISIEQNKHIRVSFAGSINQDWTDLSNLLKDLNCKNTIQKYSSIGRSGNQNSRSSIRLSGYKNVMKLLDYIYSNKKCLGLERKYLRYIHTKELLKSSTHPAFAA